MKDKNIKLLLAEDDVLLRDLYEQAFRLMGYRIETAVDGQDAVEMLDKMTELPVLILLDMMMPKMTGFDVLRYVKNSGKLKDVLVVILTNLGGEEEAGMARELGAVRYLVKDEYEPKQVVEKVEEVLAEYSAKK